MVTVDPGRRPSRKRPVRVSFPGENVLNSGFGRVGLVLAGAYVAHVGGRSTMAVTMVGFALLDALVTAFD